MITSSLPGTSTLLEKSASDNGFDLELPPQGDWLGFASSQVPLQVWLTSLGDSLFLVAVSQLNVAQALADQGTTFTNPLPEGAVGARGVVDIPSLHRLVRRAFQLSRALPNELLHRFVKETAALPRTTEAERLVIQRKGQEIFRAGLLDYWEDRCAITNLAVPALLRASHIKPWSVATDPERLDVYNGLLLAPHLDALFDLGYLTVADDRTVLFSDFLSPEDLGHLGLSAGLRVRSLVDGHRLYLSYHRQHIFQSDHAQFGYLPKGE